MKTNGIQLREAIKIWVMRRDSAISRFNSGKTYFPDADKPDLKAIAKELTDCEDAIAHLQTAQSYFNQNVMVDVGKEKFSLNYVIKRVGAAGRLEKMWRGMSKDEKDRWSRSATTRSKDEVAAQRSIDNQEALELGTEAAVLAGRMRAAIATGNQQEIEIDFLNEEFVRI